MSEEKKESSFHPAYTHAKKPLKKGDSVYIVPTNSIGKVLAVFNARGVQDVRTDADGMQDGDDLERLTASHLLKPNVTICLPFEEHMEMRMNALEERVKEMERATAVAYLDACGSTRWNGLADLVSDAEAAGDHYRLAVERFDPNDPSVVHATIEIIPAKDVP